MKNSIVVLSYFGHDHLRNSVVLFRKKLRKSYAVAPSASAILFFLAPKGMNFGRFARRSFDGGSVSREHVSTTDGAEPVRGYWRVREERHQSQIRLRADLTAQTAPHICVLVSSLNEISDLSNEHTHLHESSNGSSAFFFWTLHVRSVSQQHAIQRMKAVSSVLSASWRNRNQERGRGIMSGSCGANDMVLWPICIYLSHFWLHEQRLGLNT